MEEDNDKFLMELEADRNKRFEEIYFVRTKVIHCVALGIIALAIIAVAVIDPLTVRSNPRVDLNGALIFFMYGISFFCLLLGAFWPKILDWKAWSKFWSLEPGSALHANHIARVFSFGIPAFLGFIFRIDGVGWIVIAPLFVVSILALISIFPTRSKWERWKWRE